MKVKPTHEMSQKEMLFRLLFLIQKILDECSNEQEDYRSDLIEINEQIDLLIQKMIEDFEAIYFD